VFLVPRVRKISAASFQTHAPGQALLPFADKIDERQGLAMLEKKLWEMADELRANSKLRSSEYSVPVLGLIFLRFADQKFTETEQQLKDALPAGSRRRAIGRADFHELGALYVPDEARFARLLDLPEGADIARAISDAMKKIEEENPDLKDVLPKIYGQEKIAETGRLCQMNLAVHSLSGDIRQGNTYYEDLHRSPGKFDFVMANPPFNVDKVDKERLKTDPRFPFGKPTTDNANYLWIQLFYSALSPNGRAGFVMANSAADARGSEAEIRRQLIQSGAVDVMVAIGPNFFYTVTLPCTLWFLDRGKIKTERKDTVLFIDARHIYQQVSRALREFTPAQIEFLANIVRLYRGEQPETTRCSSELMVQHFPDGHYQDVAGLCKVATLKEIEAQGWSLNPGRYVGVAARAADEFDFAERLEELNEELEQLNAEARVLEERISENVSRLIEGSLEVI
jgi:type I restriction-modification system DNA methylase subunit